MTKKNHTLFHKTVANAPMGMLFILMIFLYAVYMTTYLCKLLSNQYDYQPNDLQEQVKEPGFLTLRTSPDATSSLNLLQTEEIAFTQEQKGAIYFLVCHILLVLLFVSLFRTIFTPPGSVSNDWNLKAEEELARAIEIEKDLLKSRWASRRQQAKEKRRAVTVDREGQIIVEEKDLLELSQEKHKNLEERDVQDFEQGNQGELPVQKDLEEVAQDDPQIMEQLNQIAFYNAMKKENKRFCAHCQKFKPERTHHCRQCNTCILKMDHHCPWVGNCIGFNNYKYFINFVFYCVVLLWFMVATYSEPVFDALYNLEIEYSRVLLVFVTYLLVGVLALVVTGFFSFHLWLIFHGRTTLEVVENKKKLEYDKGFSKNINGVFGNNILIWCLPYNPNLRGEGLEF